MLRRLTGRLSHEAQPSTPTAERVVAPDARELLYADLDAAGATLEFSVGPRRSPITNLAAAVTRSDVPAARAALADVLIRHPEARLGLQAWTLAREAGLPPSDASRRARGVVVEMGSETGVDTVAGYDDGSARYLDQAGGRVFWDVQSGIRAPGLRAAVRAAVDELITAGQAIVDATDPLERARPGPPPRASASIAVLTEGGVHLGAGPTDLLIKDSVCGPVIAAAEALMATLMDGSQKIGSKPPG